VSIIKLQVRKVAESRGIENPYGLAAKTGIAYAICYRLWHENQQRIDLKTIVVLCDSLDVEPGDLFDYKKELDIST
jgi:DNA-binding Xre family transcriptional regulator